MATTHLGVTALEGYIRWPHWFRPIGRWLVRAALVAVAALAVYGGYAIGQSNPRKLLGPLYGNVKTALAVLAILGLLPGALRTVTGAFAVMRRWVRELGRRSPKRSLPVDEPVRKPLGAGQPVASPVERDEKVPAMVR